MRVKFRSSSSHSLKAKKAGTNDLKEFFDGIKQKRADFFQTRGEILYPSVKKYSIVADYFKEMYQQTPFKVPYYVMEDDNFLKSIIHKQKDRELVKRIMSKSDSGDNLQQDEKELLEKLGNGCKSIEEQIELMAKENKRKSNMNEYELLVIPLYIKKMLNENGLYGYKVGRHKYIKDGVTGFHHRGKVASEINLNPRHDLNFIADLKAGIHEVIHAIQEHNMETMAIESDEFVLYYKKDKILRSILEDYYETNYYNISYEFDAEFRAQLYSAKLSRKEDSLFEKYYNFGIEELKKNGELLQKLNLSYKQTEIRVWNGEEYNIDDLFVQSVDAAIKNGTMDQEVLQDIKGNYLLSLEYQFEPEVREKSVLEILEDLQKEKILFKVSELLEGEESSFFELLDDIDNKEDLLTTRGFKFLELKLKKYPDEYEKNISYLKEAMMSSKYSLLAQKKIEDILKRAGIVVPGVYNYQI